MPPPSFDSQTYWDTRFQTNSGPFEWLLDYTHLKPFLHSQISSFFPALPKTLHIGCGTSDLSSHLCELIPAEQICNVDYSPVAVKLGKQRQLGRGGKVSGWETLDLLSAEQVCGFSRHGRFEVVVDKSTSDAISCGGDVVVSSPLPLQHTLDVSSSSRALKSAEVHPLYALALCLAILTSPGGKWLVCSYSSSRFPFWDEREEAEVAGASVQWLKDEGLHPGDLWRLDSFEGVVKSAEIRDGVHRPPEMCYLYVLVRTDVEVKGI